jgi:hypothetical protein
MAVLFCICLKCFLVYSNCTVYVVSSVSPKFRIVSYCILNRALIGQSVWRWATGWMIGVLGFDSRRGLGIFFTASRTALGPTQPPIQWLPVALFLGVKWPGREADRSPPSSDEVSSAWSYTSTPHYVFMAWCLVKHRDNFTFTFTYICVHFLAPHRTHSHSLSDYSWHTCPCLIPLPLRQEVTVQITSSCITDAS